MTEQDNPANMALAALKVHKTQHDAVDQQIKRLREVTGANHPENVRTVESSVLNAESNRELATAVIAATEFIDLSVNRLNVAIQAAAHTVDSGTRELAHWTKWLMIATWALAAAAIVAALIGAYATLSLAPEIITVSTPPTPPIIVTPAPVAPPAVTTPRKN
jgi:hypothetical protein